MNIYHRLRQNPIAIYLILANGLTWLGWLPALIISSQHGYPLPVIGNFREWLPTAFSSARQSFITLAFI